MTDEKVGKDEEEEEDNEVASLATQVQGESGKGIRKDMNGAGHVHAPGDQEVP